MVRCPGLDLPHLGPESRTVRVSCVEPSTVGADIVDGSMSMAGPSTLMPHIADGSGSMCWTFHVSAPYRGQCGIHVLNPPRWRLISRMVPFIIDFQLFVSLYSA